jgi:hypothetical protein
MTPVETASRMRAASLACTRCKHHQRVSRQADADQRLLKAGAEAAHAGQHHLQAAAIDGLIQGVIDLFRAIAAAAGSHAHRDARNRGRHQLGKPGFTHRVEGAYILNSRHSFPPLLLIRSK